MSKIKLVALDMDGTAYAGLGQYVEENIEPINQAIKQGVKVVFVTGRPVHAKYNRFDVYDFDKNEALVAGFNGALIYNWANNQVVEANPIPSKIVKEAFEILKEEKYSEVEVWGYAKSFDYSYINKPLESSMYLSHEGEFFHKEVVLFDNVKEVEDCYKLIMFNVNRELVERIKLLGLEVAWNEGIHAAEINLKGINKAYALKFLSKHYSIDASEMMSMGDGSNDIPMLEYAGLSIATANATDVVKECAKEVSQYTNLEGAVAKAIKKYVLGEN
ncbi:HAD family hydrolase [Spiroplasma chinense]|uniref:HAD family hydrolase n=1 Tax=Spiroplasma chinense TaxID=216932 RepID=A0A5B9Y621_9MOLU|nr:Cof-type HAD-IIB family hydrolase [Spiroplasma chinense]QEH61492.1 HAD family hydrolase [Spiroplasma chinense]